MASLDYSFVAPLILWSIVTINAAVFCFIKKPFYKLLVIRATFIPVIFGLLCQIMNALIDTEYASIFSKINTCRTIFDIISRSFGPAPGLIAYLLMSRKRGNKAGVCIAYLGCLWIVVLMVASFVVLLIHKRGSTFKDSTYDFVYCGQLGFAIVFVVLILMHRNTLHGAANISLIAYSILLILSETFKVVLYLVYFLKAIDQYVIQLIFVEFTMTLSLLLAVFFGPFWTNYTPLERKDKDEGDTDADEDKFEDISEDNSTDSCFVM
ncbi:uncharacterized protein EV154DRAFT_489802 [Mucor mucedo]|uniref:uncharacterized protein n=1 Tax=Mucor mucedo TaxID=29922 RepID=UPI002220022F|nr:uncharacterized protein EV154DRAFT_489802 [Mucor mucedo]KAI7897361.1 hypothetical protein EV154DRAFT_489802 [Mucor mucedo]